MSTAPIPVAVGLVLNPQQQILMAIRPTHVDQGGLWEFPGGKLEAGENEYQGLCRELFEEVNLVVLEAEKIESAVYQYPQKTVCLHFWHVKKYQNEPVGKEGQTVFWQEVAALVPEKMPAANHSILKRLATLVGVR